MAGKLGKVSATLELYNTQFMKALDASGKAFVRTASGMAKVGGLAAASGAAITTPLIAAAKSFTTYGDKISKMAGRTGIGVEALQELGYAAEQSGASLEDIEGAVTKMNRSISMLQNGNAAAEKAFEDLGLSIESLQGLSTEEQFKLIADRIGAIQDPALRTQAAIKLLGGSGQKLQNLFADGAAGMEEYAENAQKLGLVLSEADTADAVEMSNALTDAGKAIKALWMNIGGAVAPIITEIVQEAAKITGTVILWVRENKQLIATVFKIAAAVIGVGTAIAVVGASMGAIVTVAGTIVGAITAVIGTVTALVSSIGIIPLAIAGVGAYFLYESGIIGDAINGLTETWSAAWGGIVASVMKGDLQTAFDITWLAVQITWQKGVNWIMSLWRGTVDSVKMTWRGSCDLIANAWSITVALLAKGIANLMASFELLARTIKIAWDCIKNPGNIMSAFSKLKTETAKVNADLRKTFKNIDDERDRAVSGRLEASQRAYEAEKKASEAAYESGKARVAELTDQMNDLIAKANEPLIAPEKEKAVQRQVEAFKAIQSLTSNLAGGVGSFSSRAIQAGQSFGDKTIKEIKNGIDRLCSLSEETNDCLENMAGPV